jgi:acetylornithine aminotransferase
MIGIELDIECSELVKLALADGLLINVTADHVVRLLPPLIMQRAEAQQVITQLGALITAFLAANRIAPAKAKTA